LKVINLITLEATFNVFNAKDKILELGVFFLFEACASLFFFVGLRAPQQIF
jgi:hypothetical protein